jgi:hypothetical protein
VDPFGTESVILEHATKSEVVANIAKEGFKAGTDGLIWFRDLAAAAGGNAKWQALRPISLTVELNAPILPVARANELLLGQRIASGLGLPKGSQAWWGVKWEMVSKTIGSNAKLGFMHKAGAGFHYALTPAGAADAAPMIINISGPGSGELGALLRSSPTLSAGTAELAAAEGASSSMVTIRGVSGALGWLMIAERYTLGTCANVKEEGTGFWEQLREDIKSDIDTAKWIFSSLFINQMLPFMDDPNVI